MISLMKTAVRDFCFILMIRTEYTVYWAKTSVREATADALQAEALSARHKRSVLFDDDIKHFFFIMKFDSLADAF